MKKSAKTHKSSEVKHATKEPEHHQVHTRPTSSKKLFITIGIVVILAVGLLWLLFSKGASTMDKSIVAKVNGELIKSSEVDKLFAQAQQQGFPLTKDQVVEQMITKKVLLQEAQRQKITIDDAAIDKYIKDLESLITQPIDPLLEKMNITKQEFRQQIQEQLAVTKLLADKQQMQSPATDQQIQEFYEANEEYFVTPEQVNASHILVKTEEEAKDILVELQDDKNFAQLAKEKSIDPSAKTNGGNLGFFGKGQMVAEFEKAAFALDIGEMSEPVESQFGFHIILVHEKKKAGKLSLEEAKADIRKALNDEQVKKAVDAYVKELVSKAKIERFASSEEK